MSNFDVFGRAVRVRFDEMAKFGKLFQVGVDRDDVWNAYLAAFPPGSNPIFRKRTEYDCSCCKHWVRGVGHVVAIQNGALSTVWDLNGLPSPFQEVADAMAAYVRGIPVRDVFRTFVPNYGAEFTREAPLDGGPVVRWHHFSCEVPGDYLVQKKDLGEVQDTARSAARVLERGLETLSPACVDEVLEFIRNKELYLGDQYRAGLEGFKKIQQRWLALPETGPARSLLVWENWDSPGAKFRNNVLGTLVQDLSEGVDTMVALRKYDSKTAPTNFNRSSAPITQQAVDAALRTLRELNLEPALERRYARLSDVSVNSVLFVDGAARGKMKDGLAALLAPEVKTAPIDPQKAEKISIDDFVRDVLPGIQTLDVLLENRLSGNFVSLTAPQHDGVEPIFYWGNDFAWSYDGNVTDSIKDRVKAAGGKVENVALRVSLAWTNTDDLDLWIKTPRPTPIYFGHMSECGGVLDVDMNRSAPLRRDAVENVRWNRAPPDGRYEVTVHNYSRRESVDGGFTVEIEHAGGLTSLRWPKNVAEKERVGVAQLYVERGLVTNIVPFPGVERGEQPREKWGLRTGDLVRVDSLVLSPNYWSSPGSGNRHHFFVLRDCVNPEPTRGIYNEFLRPELQKHRKVFEVLGDKTKVPFSPEQMSGVGFSSGRGDRVVVRASGPKTQKLYDVAF